MTATDVIAYRDAYARSVRGVVLEINPAGEHTLPTPRAQDEFDVVLDQTVFYPGGGGQPADMGWLRIPGDEAEPTQWPVILAAKAGGAIVHRARFEHGTPSDWPQHGFGEPGSELIAEIDWPRRHLLMRTHTALHTLCGVVWNDYGAQVTGGNMEPGAGRMDFEFETMSGELVGQIEERVNAELTANRPIHVRVLPRDEAFAIPDLIRTKINLLPPGITEVRIVEIEGLDLQADGGTHVANTSEVGQIRVTGYESKGRINKRIRIEVL
ncbi:MAG: alanyl-tRNA editing protein [Candidatus Limnocylindrales bacterium]